MVIDLHTHSTASDGTLAPAALLARARTAGVHTLALTDHDTIAGIEALSATDTAGLRLIAGVEFSTWWETIGVHVLGLNIDIRRAAMRTACERQLDARDLRARAIGARLAARGIADAYAGATALADGARLGRPHFARYLVEHGHARDYQQAFKRYLKHPREAAGVDFWASLDIVIGWIHAAGGSAVLAHPAKYKLSAGRLDRLIRAFAANGGDGLEIVSGSQEDAVTVQLGRLAVRYGLAGSVGSDFHRPDQAWAALGNVAALPASVTAIWDTW